MKSRFTLTLVIIAITFSHLAWGQQVYRQERSTLDITSSVGFADKQTRDHFGTAFAAGLRKEWSLGKLVSLNAAADYQTLSGKNSAPSLNLVSLGGGITFYPNYLVALILKQNYDEETARKDGFYLDETFLWNLNSNAYGRGGNMPTFKIMANFDRYRLNDGLAISPKLGAQSVFLNRIGSAHNSFSYLLVGVGLNFGRFKR
ncbi:hypothetical protein [Mucilaginibacter sp. CSA2-8R]|uniref:hypothetical protein n=1 Tax=Mucilaginibacter sp. CSA2-8R TaxID=3141542 RepID=UPI00315D227A